MYCVARKLPSSFSILRERLRKRVSFRITRHPAKIVATLLFLLTPVWSNEVQWVPFEKGLEQASNSDKYVFIDFYADWCSYCKIMDSTSYRDAKVVEEMKKSFVPVKVDTEAKKKIKWKGDNLTMADFSSELGVSSLPTLIFLNSELEIIGSYSSFADGEMLHNLLTYVSSGSRERNESLEEFLANRDKNGEQ